MLVKIKNESNYLKDTTTKAVININNTNLQDYRRLRNNLMQINENSNRVSNMEREIEVLKQLLKDLQGTK